MAKATSYNWLGEDVQRVRGPADLSPGRGHRRRRGGRERRPVREPRGRSDRLPGARLTPGSPHLALGVRSRLAQLHLPLELGQPAFIPVG